VVFVFFFALLAAGRAFSQVVPDNGSGTANLPPAPFAYAGATQIIDGLAPGDTIDNNNLWYIYTSVSEVPGGSFVGGNKQTYNAQMPFSMTGTGSLVGFSRSLTIPVAIETHSAHRTPGTTPQTFDTDLFQLFGQLPLGDPDFDLLRITAGTGFGMPSPGTATLTQAGAFWSVSSFFDVTYRIDFIGKPGGALSGRSGSTTGTSRFTLGQTTPVELTRFTAD
jgi:hypothetical protein